MALILISISEDGRLRNIESIPLTLHLIQGSMHEKLCIIKFTIAG